jgi:hypothetical protein
MSVLSHASEYSCLLLKYYYILYIYKIFYQAKTGGLFNFIDYMCYLLPSTASAVAHLSHIL